jgi:copper transport protein
VPPAARSAVTPLRLGVLAVGLLLLAAGLADLLAPRAWLASSTPPAGASLPVAPSAVRIAFTERLGAESHADVSVGARRAEDVVAAAVEPDPADPSGTTLLIPLPSFLPPGVYRVSWTARTGSSSPLTPRGHLTFGTFYFGVGVPVDPRSQPATESAAPAERREQLLWSALGALLLGGALFGRRS